ncbi:MAG: hypothetical protein GY757_34085, partial [bacterium]|nr:hypothetical protein [bacterium]
MKKSIHSPVKPGKVCRDSDSPGQPGGMTFNKIIYESKHMEEVIARAKILAKTGNTILIQGEIGSGKKILSHSIHNYSNRKN